MSTRFAIARPDPGDPARWTGIHGNGDGHPGYTGKHLFAHVVTRFKGDLEAAAEFFIDQHPAGWAGLPEAFGQVECYCHDRGEGTGHRWTETEKGSGSMDWTYVLRPEGLEVRRWNRGVAALVPWDQERVDWEEVGRAGYAL